LLGVHEIGSVQTKCEFNLPEASIAVETDTADVGYCYRKASEHSIMNDCTHVMIHLHVGFGFAGDPDVMKLTEVPLVPAGL